ncbi:hypothetical protein RJT34_15382 [Clitoria ternatea]|uniref:Uncharacterized protein n=1 Tax=Clitoria ternatea TaxID=43366 RepID=A0AAN9J6Q3_CLITE
MALSSTLFLSRFNSISSSLSFLIISSFRFGAETCTILLELSTGDSRAKCLFTGCSWAVMSSTCPSENHGLPKSYNESVSWKGFVTLIAKQKMNLQKRFNSWCRVVATRRMKFQVIDYARRLANDDAGSDTLPPPQTQIDHPIKHHKVDG